MELIRQNPYHVIGILAGANQRTIAKQKAKINAFQKVGKSIEFDTDLEFTGNPDRSNTAIEKAFANIEINQNKLFNALFWFVSHNHLDETALTYLQSGDLKKAEDIWQKITNGKEASSRNFTAFNNLGTLKLANALAKDSINIENFREGVRLKTELLTSDNFSDFCHLVTDETYTVDQEKELDIFVNALLEEVNKEKNLEAKKISALIGSIHSKLKSIVSEKLTDTPLHNIERKTEQTKKKRNENPENGLQLARNLYRDTKSDLTTLSELLGKSDLKYKMVADKLAKEFLQCGIDYFKEYQDREEEHGSVGIPQEHSQYAGNTSSTDDLGAAVMRLFRIAKSIAVGTQTKERIAENIDGLQEWMDNADERRKQKLIGEDLRFIASKLERFQRLRDTVTNAQDLVTSCKPKLQNIKGKLGATDDFYLKLSSAVVNNAQGMLVTVVNDEQELFQLAVNPNSVNMEKIAHIAVRRSGGSRSAATEALTNLITDRYTAISNLKSAVNGALSVSKKLGELDMVPELRMKYNQNHSTLKSISSQLNSSSGSSSSSSSGGGGCYIATMAYGSYEHPQVLELRKFRDETLSKSIAGRDLIRIYYWLSPKLVKFLRGNTLINSLIRKMLNQVIKHIK
ncbi:MAG: hypothetical protein H6573_31525 [Lewinellaceae bacterium]|nr:hypothetical protein [Lewinellaceae bacterium]